VVLVWYCFWLLLMKIILSLFFDREFDCIRLEKGINDILEIGDGKIFIKTIKTVNIMNVNFFEGDLWTARKIENTYVVRLKNLVNIMEGLTDFVLDQKIIQGKIKGIGTLAGVTLNFFNPSKMKNFNIKFEEKISFSDIFGTISEIDGTPIFHLETTLKRENHTTLAGHLLDARIIGINEFFFYPLETEIIQFKNEIFGFN